MKEAPLIYNFLNKKELNEFEELKELLSLVGIDYEIDPFLVRGLDYYSDTTFEFTLRENNKYAVPAGGRHSNLVKELGGDNVSGIAAGGIERLANLQQ